jgi:hydroxymethylpyrimidine pyrophosphatase-like HAD family hydrolase
VGWLPRLIATDLDGTLFGPDATVSPRTIAALRAAHDAGIEVVAVTGRSHHTAAERLAPVGVLRHLVCSNGATRYDLVDGRVVGSHPLDDEHLHAVLAVDVPGIGFGLETVSGFVYDEVFLAHLPRLRQQGHRPGLLPPARPCDPVVKVMIGHPELAHDELLGRVVERLAVPVEAAVSTAPFIEVTAAGVDKAFGLAGLCRDLGIGAADVLAFGDNGNDLPMLAWAGRSVAVANGHPAVRQLATDHAGHHAEDGVAVFIEALLA